jgi:nicotinate-nucleotide adenylyltransferase
MGGKSSKKKVGLYGGTFDPIHLGHINLAIALKEKHSLNEIWFIPTQINPLKLDCGPSSSMEDRIEMVRLAIQDIPYFRLKDLESHREAPSYTIDTLRELLKNKDEGNEYFLLLGQDAIAGFFHWKLVDEIVQKIPLLIASRSGVWHDNYTNNHDPLVVEAIRKGLTQTRYMDISSTEIRLRLREGLYCGHLLPASVFEYIFKNRLYVTP